MATQNKPKSGDNPDQAADVAPGSQAGGQAGGGGDDVLKPFQEAAQKFLQTYSAATATAQKKQAQSWLDYQQQVRQAEHDAQQAVLEATKKHVDQTSQPQEQGAKPEDAMSAVAQAQTDYEKQVRQIYTDTQTKVADIAQKIFGQGGAGGGAAQSPAPDPRQDAFQSYLQDLQQAWSGTKSVDPQTLSAIASTILATLNAVQGQ